LEEQTGFPPLTYGRKKEEVGPDVIQKTGRAWAGRSKRLANTTKRKGGKNPRTSSKEEECRSKFRKARITTSGTRGLINLRKGTISWRRRTTR